MTGLLDKVVVVTGAARGTGRSSCERFADEGADVIAIDVPALPMNYGTPQEKFSGAVGGVRRSWPTCVILTRQPPGCAPVSANWGAWT